MLNVWGSCTSRADVELQVMHCVRGRLLVLSKKCWGKVNEAEAQSRLKLDKERLKGSLVIEQWFVLLELLIQNLSNTGTSKSS